MSLQLSYGLKLVNPVPVDEYKGIKTGSTWRPYNDVAEVNATIVLALRYVGMTVFVTTPDGLKEYWYKDGVLDVNLVEKTSGAGGSSYIPELFITSIEAASVGGNVVPTYQNYPESEAILPGNPVFKTVTSFSTNTTNVNVSIEWDRNSSGYLGDPQFIPYDAIVVDGVLETIAVWDLEYTELQKVGSTISMKVNVNLENTSGSVSFIYGGQTYTVAAQTLVPPVITSVTIGDLPLLPSGYGFTAGQKQTKLKANDKVNVTVIADKPFTKLIVANSGLSNGFTINNIAPTTVYVFEVIAKTHLDNLTRLIGISSQVVDAEGTTSEMASSSNVQYINQSVSFSSPTIHYLSNFSALKDYEEASVTMGSNLNATHYKGVPLAIGGLFQLESAIWDSNNDEWLIQKSQPEQGDPLVFNDSVNNLTLFAINQENGSEKFINLCIAIADLVPALASNNIDVARLGTTTNITLSFNQKLKINVVEVASANYGLVAAINTNYTQTKSVSLTPNTASGNSDAILSMQISGVSLSGKAFNLNLANRLVKSFKIQGFASKQLVINSTTDGLKKFIGHNVFDMTKFTMSGVVNSAEPLSLGNFTRLDSFPALPALPEPKEFKLNSTLAANTNNEIELSPKISQFNYQNGTTMRLTIEETV